MKAFVVNRHGRLVFPAKFLGELDFTVLETLDQFTAVIGRDFEAKAPTGTDILARVESEAYPGHFELLRDLGQNLFWANRYTIPMFDRRPTRWRDLAKRRDDVFLPVLTPWEDSERKVAAVERAFRALPATWDAEAEDRVFGLLFDLFRNKLHHATELPAIKPTVAEFLDQPGALTFVMPDFDPDYPVFRTEDIIDAHESVPELEALTRWAMVLHNQYPWDRSRTELRGPGQIGDDDFVVAFHPRNRDVLAFIERVRRSAGRRRKPATLASQEGPIPRVLVVQHHRPAHERLEFRHVLAGVKDLLEGEHRVVGVMVRHGERQRPGLAEELRHGRLDRGQFGGVVELGPEHAEQQVEHPVLGLGVPCGGQLAEGALDRGHLPLAVLPGGQHRQEDIVAVLGQVTPPGRPLVEHGDRVPVDPEQVLAQVTQ